MEFKLKINGSESEKAAYVGWTPVKCILMIDHFSGAGPISVTVTAGNYGNEGQLSLYTTNDPSAVPVNEIQFEFQSQSELTFYIAGRFRHASVGRKDTYVRVESGSGEVPFLLRDIMVRVRKNANTLTPREIEDFLTGFLELSQLQTRGSYSANGYTIIPNKALDEIVLMHTLDAANEIHRRTSFHPWHRAFLMHLEREIQENHPHVTIPYWKFDDGAANVFTENFIGKTAHTEFPDAGTPGNIHYGEKLQPIFDQTNPLYTYAKHIFWGGPLKRAYRYKDLDPSEHKPNDNLRSEKEIICDNGDDPIGTFAYWSNYEEVNSHNKAHYAFTGHVVNIGKDPVDPLFFMMHSNVDRLWALWQAEYERFDGNHEKTYPYQGKYTGERGGDWAQYRKLNEDGFYNVGNCDVGNFADDTMWPWDLDHELGRPMRAWNTDDLGGHEMGKVPQINIKFPGSVTSKYPDGPLTVKSTIDYQGRTGDPIPQGFDYDSIPYFDHDIQTYCDEPMDTVQEHNEAFLNKKLPLSQRLKAAERAFMQDKDEQDQLLTVIKDKGEEIEIRLKSIKLVDESKSHFLDVSLDILADETESADIKAELIHLIFASKRSNRYFPSRKPRFFNQLRGLIRDNNPELRFQAMEVLTAHGDEIVQEFLIEELSKNESEFISKPDAIFFLRENPKPQHARLFRELFEKSNDPEIRKAAIEGLGNDPDSIELLKEVVLDKTQNYKIREAGALSLHHLDQSTMNNLAERIITEPENGPGINLFTAIQPNSDEVDFKAGLMNMLTYTGDIALLKQNERLKSALNQVVDQDADMKANFRGSFETSSGGPTIIEQMASKLLERLS